MTHHIRVDFLTKFVTNRINEIIQYAEIFEDEFVKISVSKKMKEICLQNKKNQKYLKKLKKRDKEPDNLFESLYEDKVLKRISEQRYEKLSLTFEAEQLEVKLKISEFGRSTPHYTR
jgi:lysyl-tRNA synthetase class I